MKPEQILQINFINWINYHYPDIGDLTYHFANERKCTPQQGVLLRRMGVKRGVADLFIAYPRAQTNFSGLWLELKTETGKLTKEQREFLEKMRAQGYCASCAWGIEQAKDIFLAYINNNPYVAVSPAVTSM